MPDAITTSPVDTRTDARTGRLSVEEATAQMLGERPVETGTRKPTQARELPPDHDTEATVTDTPEPGTGTEPAEEPDAGAAEPDVQTEAEPDATAEDDPEYDIKVGDKVEKVKLSDLQNGYLRQQDYSRKTAEIANARRAFEAEMTEVRGERAAYAEMLGALKAQIENGGQQINWEELRRVDPVGFLEQKELARERQGKLAAIKQEEQRLSEARAKEQLQLIDQARAEAQSILMQRIPTWQQPETRQREITDMVKTAVEQYGYRPEELDRIIDPRFVLLARDAMFYRKSRGEGLPGKRVAPQPGRPVPARRHVPNSDPNASRKQTAQVQFSRTPTINSAIDAILAERGEE
jgi:hypothetical protein